MTQEKASAIILAGGKSTRMQGQNKCLLSIHCKPLIQHIIEQLEPYFDDIIIGSDNIEAFAFTGKQVVVDIEKDKGPLMGILSCLKASRNHLNFITACDIPEINIPFIKRMLRLCAEADVVLPRDEKGRYEPLFAVYAKSVIPAIEKAIALNERKITKLLPHAKVRFVDFENDGWYFNINEREDWERYLLENSKR